MNKKKTIHFQKSTNSTLCGASNPFDRNSIKKTGKKEKVSCQRCIEILEKK